MPRSSSWINSWNSSSTCPRTMGSRPLVGSSISSRRGLWAMAAAIDSFIFIPLEKSLIFFPQGSSSRFKSCS